MTNHSIVQRKMKKNVFTFIRKYQKPQDAGQYLVKIAAKLLTKIGIKMKKIAIKIESIPAPTEESEARKNELKAKKKRTEREENELFHLEMRQFWNCEC